jgi:hypothetical protein
MKRSIRTHGRLWLPCLLMVLWGTAHAEPAVPVQGADDGPPALTGGGTFAGGPLLAQMGGAPGGSGSISTYGMSDSRFAGGVSPTAANPLVSLVLNGFYADFSRSAPFTVPGFALGPDVADGAGKPGMHLAESELTIYGNIDPYLFGSAVLSFSPDNGAAVEEAFIQTTSLPLGFTVKAGRFHSSIGYLNVLHRHADDFVDTPLVYSAFLNGQLADDGAQLRWLAPTDFLLEFGTELLNGQNWPAAGSRSQGKGTRTQFIKLADDIGDSASYLVGVSHVDSEATDRLSGGDPANNNAGGLSFTGTTSLNIYSLVYKWSPLGNIRYSQFKFQYEYFEGDEHGTYTLIDPAGNGAALTDANGDPVTVNLKGSQGVQRTGWYAQAVYKFHERWRVGLRQSEVTAELPRDPNAAGTDLDPHGHVPAMTSVMVEFWPSDFSQFRAQYSSDNTVRDHPTDRFYLQYIVSLGAHGAHAY